MSKKFMVSLLSVMLMASLCIAFAGPGYVMAAVGLSGQKDGPVEKMETRVMKSIKTGLQDMAVSMGKKDAMIYSSSDDIVVINAKKNSEEISVEIEADGSKFPEFGIKDLNRVITLAKEYLKPVFDETQAMNLCTLFFSEAFKEYKNGNKEIKLIKEYEGVTIECMGNIGTGIVSVYLRSTLGVKKCLPDIRKTTEMKVLPH